MTEEEIISIIALTEIPGLGPIGIKNLLNMLGSANDIFKKRLLLTELVPGCTKRIVDSLDCPEAFRRAEKELSFIQKNNLTCLPITDPAYPLRLKECYDAPTILFYKGNAELNATHIINMIGTRNASEYGRQLCNRFVNELKEIMPDVLIVSGLAYGIDIYTHRAAVDNNISTIAVLAHGLDRIYPANHRKVAIDMLKNGGLLTEYLSGTNPDRQNFVRRNRIVAGMSDATIVVESAAKGGALITAEIANSYNRDCFAFPGRVGDEYSQGCNKLIKDNKAALITSAEDFVKAMCWDSVQKTNKNIPIQRQMFIDLSEEEEQIVSLLQSAGEQQINVLVTKTSIPIQKLNAILFELEMKGVIRTLAGGMYKLID